MSSEKSANGILRTEKTELEDSYGGLENEYASLKNANTDLRNENADLKNENTKLKSENQSVKSENSGLKDEASKKETQNSKLEKENKDLKSKNDTLTKENNSLTKEKTNLKKTADEYKADADLLKKIVDTAKNNKIGYASESYHASTGIVVLHKSGISKKITVRYEKRSGTNIHMERKEAARYVLTQWDDSWSNHTIGLTLTPSVKGVNVFELSNTADSEKFCIIVAVVD